MQKLKQKILKRNEVKKRIRKYENEEKIICIKYNGGNDENSRNGKRCKNNVDKIRKHKLWKLMWNEDKMIEKIWKIKSKEKQKKI